MSGSPRSATERTSAQTPGLVGRLAALLARCLASLYPWPVTASEDLRDAVGVLGWTADPAAVVRAGYGLALVVGLLGAIAVVFAPPPFGYAVALTALALALAAAHAVHAAPEFLATARRTRALGDAPAVLVLVVLRMRLAPSPERAAAFAAEAGTGRLARSLGAHVRRAEGTERTGLDAFGDEWGEWFPSLGRGVGLVAAAGRVPDRDRERALDRALTVVQDGTRRQAREFAGEIRGPATVLYAFGVLLPTALVALLPAASAAGFALPPWLVAVVYDLALPIVLLWASAWLLTRRPVTFPPPAVGPSHPDVTDCRWLALAAGTVTAAVGGGAAAIVLPSWGPPVVVLGVGPGVALVVHCRPYVAVYEDVRAVERELTDALSLVGRRVAAGRSVERALAAAASELDGATGDVLAAGTRRQRRLDVGVETAFLGARGALQTVPSPQVRGSVSLLAIAAREGEPAGGAVLAVADHLDDLRAVERDARESVRTVVETLGSTGALFGPLVGGATVALAGHVTGDGLALAGGPGASEAAPVGATAAGPAVSLSWLGLAVGWYVLVLAAVLTTLAVGLERGLDRHLVGYRIGRALVLATGAYVIGYLAAAAIA